MDLRDELRKLKMPQLKHIARMYNMSERIAFSKLKKAELIEALNEHLNYKRLLAQQVPPKKPKVMGLKRSTSIPLPEDEDEIRLRMNQLSRFVAERRSEGKDVSKQIREYTLLKKKLESIV